MNDLKIFLNNFLDTINYPDSKEEFINKLLSAIYLDAVDESLKTLSSEKQTEIQDKFKLATTPQLAQEVINTNFDQNLFQQTLQKSSQKLFSEYLETIDDVLTEEQKTKLDQFFASQVPNASQTPV